MEGGFFHSPVKGMQWGMYTDLIYIMNMMSQ